MKHIVNNTFNNINVDLNYILKCLIKQCFIIKNVICCEIKY